VSLLNRALRVLQVSVIGLTACLGLACRADVARSEQGYAGVELVKNQTVGQPRAENAQFRMASGIANGLQEALQQATTNLSLWLADDYRLTPNEVAIVLGTAIQYQIAEIVDPLVHVVAKIDKKALAGLQQ
jgi:acetamidase/formamidase